MQTKTCNLELLCNDVILSYYNSRCTINTSTLELMKTCVLYYFHQRKSEKKRKMAYRVNNFTIFLISKYLLNFKVTLRKYNEVAIPSRNRFKLSEA